MSDSLVSIVTPLYNAAPFIKRTIKSIQKQTYQNWELLIVDDCSSDNCLRVVEQIAKSDKRIKVFQNDKNSGPGVTRNRGIAEAQGKYITFLDADDQWLKHKVSTQVSFMQRHNLNFTFGYYSAIDEQGNTIEIRDSFPDKVNYRDTLKSNKIGCLTAMYDAENLGKTYMNTIRKRQDYTLWLKLLKKTEYAYCVPEVLATYTVREKSVSSNKIELIKYNWHVLRHIEKLSFLKSAYYLGNHIFYKIFG